MYKALLLLVLVVLSVTAQAQWELQQSRDGNWIATRAAGSNQLIVGQHPAGTDFLLALIIPAEAPPLSEQAYLSVDRFPPEPVRLRLLEKRPQSRLFRIELAQQHKDRLVQRMIAGLAIRFGYDTEDDIHDFLQFTLLGFSAAWRELQAVNQQEGTALRIPPDGSAP